MTDSWIAASLLIKAIAYIGWCYQGARIHDHHDRLLLRGFLYGIVRLLMGLILGTLLIGTLAGVLAETVPPVVIYAVVFIPVRWLEWSLMAVTIDLDNRTSSNFLWGTSSASRLWRIGGIVISCAADSLWIVAGQGFPMPGSWGC